MQKRKKILAGVLAGTLALSACPFALAASYNDSSVTGGSEEWQAWVSEWESVATDYTKVSLTPGADETQLNFAWYSKSEDGKTATPVVHFGTDKDNLTAFTGTSGQVDTSLTDGVAYDYNHVVVTGLEPNTTYYYTVEKNGVQTEVQEYKTGSFESVKILYVGDPQIGASKGQTQGSDTLKADSGAANTAARNDAFAWNRTLEIASAQNPDLNFVISAGDQVNKTGQAKEEEYAGYLSASVLSGLPVATTIGNHDSLNPDYTYHFNNPNTTGYGETEAGGDYYYSYGSGLFIVLNTNNYNVAEHEKTIQEAVASDPDAAWRVVTIHQDIYGTGLDHSDTDGMILRTQLTPIFDEYDIDVVLQGHDHTYSRSKLLYGDGQTHGTYEFRLNEDGSDYDWDNAYNTQTDEKIPLYPEEGDTAGTAAHDAFQADNGCYTIEDTTGNTVVNPKGTLYMTANSASGSKFYELIAAQQDYIAARSQNWLPSYSVIEMDEDSFSIVTYQVTAEGKTEAIDDAFTIQKSAAGQDEQADVATLTADGETYYRLRDVAASVNGSDSQFNVAWNDGVVVTTGAAYTDAVPAAVPTAGAAASLTLTVDGESVTTDAMLADGNYYVTASFLATLGVSLGA
ncbi:metallophosphoesterase family protein [Intestinimonas aquisgranensis]|nr:metallophosphoesterase family protein [Intestinimonas aquisgranensis]